jgi:hypothetical protein
MGRFPEMSCVLLWSAIIRVAKQHISAWRAVVAVMLLALTVAAGCGDVRPFCELGGSCSSDDTDDGGDGEEDDCINRIGQENTIELASTPEEIDVRVGNVVNVEVRVVTPVAGRTYSLAIIEQPTSGRIPNDSIVTAPNAGTMTFRFEATTSTEFTTDNMEVSVTDSASEEGCLDITIRVQRAVPSQ